MFDEELEMFRDSVRAFCAREVPLDLAREMDEKDYIPTTLIKQVADVGYLGLPFPEEFGGQGGGIRELVVIAEELSVASSAIAGLVMSTAVFGGLNIWHSGTEAQRGELLPKLCSGQMLSAMAITEPGAGSDVAAVSLSAKRTDAGWRLDGNKMFTSGAKEASLIMVVARSAKDGKRHDGLGIFLVPNPSDGLSINSINKIGNRGVSTCEMALDGVEIPADAVLGGEEMAASGWTQAMKTFEIERIVMTALSLGIARRAIRDATAYAAEREQFGRPIGSFQSIAHMVADMATSVEAGAALLYSVTDRYAAGLPCRTEAAMAKLFMSETARKVTLDGMQIMGGYGYVTGADMDRHMRDALLGTVGAGTSQIQRTIIAKALGLG